MRTVRPQQPTDGSCPKDYYTQLQSIRHMNPRATLQGVCMRV